MKDVFNNYFQAHFKQVNDLSDVGFKKSARYYGYFYNDFLPADKNAKILDLGCGVGQFLYFLEKQGFKNYYGIDVSAQQIDFCKEKITDKVQAIDGLEFLKNKKDIFDLIVLNDVLEHISKDRVVQLLRVIYSSLKKNGSLFIKVPNMANPFGLLDRYKDITHELGFTEHSLKETLVAARFEKIAVKGASYPVISFKTAVSKVAEKIIHFCLKLAMLVQGYSGSKFLDKTIIAVAKK